MFPASNKNLNMKPLMISLLLFFWFSSAFSQEVPLSRKNVIFMEGAGAFMPGAGFGNERYLALNHFSRLSFRGGVGVIKENSKPGFFKNLAGPVLFLGESLLIGKRFQVEIGVNYTSSFRTTTAFGDEPSVKDHGMQLLGGIRYQNWSNGLMARLFYIPPVGEFVSLFGLGGVSFGYAF